jgi:hypothetical protein
MNSVSESETEMRLGATGPSLKKKQGKQEFLSLVIPLYYGTTSPETTRCHSEILEFK